MSLGEKISKIRKKNNMTQEQLATMLDVSRQTISKWETDAVFPETEKLIKLSKIFECSLDYLLNNTNPDYSYQNDIRIFSNQNSDYGKFIGAWCNIDLRNWDSGYYTSAIIGQDKQYLHFYQLDKHKNFKYGIVLKEYIETITKLSTKYQKKLPSFFTISHPIFNPFTSFLGKKCNIQMHSPNFVSFIL